MTENNNFYSASIGTFIGIITGITGMEITKTILFAFIGGVSSVAGKQIFLYIKKKL